MLFLAFDHDFAASGNSISPSSDICKLWHNHMTLFDQTYSQFCEKHFGKHIEYRPTSGDCTSDSYIRFLVLYTEIYGEIPKEVGIIWPMDEKIRGLVRQSLDQRAIFSKKRNFDIFGEKSNQFEDSFPFQISKKSRVDEPKKRITVYVETQDGEIFPFSVFPTIKFGTIKAWMENRMAVNSWHLRMLFYGLVVHREETLEDYKAEDGDIINVILQQSGC